MLLRCIDGSKMENHNVNFWAKLSVSCVTLEKFSCGLHILREFTNLTLSDEKIKKCEAFLKVV